MSFLEGESDGDDEFLNGQKVYLLRFDNDKEVKRVTFTEVFLRLIKLVIYVSALEVFIGFERMIESEKRNLMEGQLDTKRNFTRAFCFCLN